MPTRRAVTPRHAARAACAAVAALLATSGCGLADDPRADGTDADPTPAASHSPLTPEQPTTTDEAQPELQTSTVAVGDVVLEVGAPSAATVQAGAQGPGTQTVTFVLAPGESAELTLTSAGTLDVDSDGSISVLDGDDSPRAAVGPPEPPSGTEDGAPRIEVTDVDATTARVEVDDRATPSAQGSGSAAGTEPVSVTFVIGTSAIESATWGENEGGRSLAVDPTDWVRHAGEAGLDLIRTQLVATEPEADSAPMDDQLVCHAMGAPDKGTWNLEPWRPDVGLILTAAAHCNPV
ncbi:DUF2599 domain-containing protein [Promicromonospora sp. Populi]|uniref:DUF2599 domain-containing protein n=1 Tax=Promicromonospora sp. Populi TaxID=3239420 RepID=UPI0034E2D8F0